MAIFNPSDNNQSQTGDQSWRNDAFVNISLPTADGGKRKIGSVGLKLRKAAEKELIEYLQADPSRVASLFSHASFDFQLVDGSTSSGFAFPDEEAA